MVTRYVRGYSAGSTLWTAFSRAHWARCQISTHLRLEVSVESALEASVAVAAAQVVLGLDAEPGLASAICTDSAILAARLQVDREEASKRALPTDGNGDQKVGEGEGVLRGEEARGAWCGRG